MPNIPSGYQLHVRTWENDGDNYSTQVQSGLTRADVLFSLDVAKRFESENASSSPGWGNAGQSSEDLTDFIKETMARHPDLSAALRNEWLQDPGYVYGVLEQRILGRTSDYGDEENFCRVFEDYKVFFLPREGKDVTDQF